MAIGVTGAALVATAVGCCGCGSFCDMVGTFLSSQPVPGQSNLLAGNTPHRVAVAVAARDGKIRRRAASRSMRRAARDWAQAPAVIARRFRGARELRSRRAALRGRGGLRHDPLAAAARLRHRQRARDAAGAVPRLARRRISRRRPGGDGAAGRRDRSRARGRRRRAPRRHHRRERAPGDRAAPIRLAGGAAGRRARARRCRDACWRR